MGANASRDFDNLGKGIIQASAFVVPGVTNMIPDKEKAKLGIVENPLFHIFDSVPIVGDVIKSGRDVNQAMGTTVQGIASGDTDKLDDNIANIGFKGFDFLSPLTSDQVFGESKEKFLVDVGAKLPDDPNKVSDYIKSNKSTVTSSMIAKQQAFEQKEEVKKLGFIVIMFLGVMFLIKRRTFAVTDNGIVSKWS